MDNLQYFFTFILHLDQYLISFINLHGAWIYFLVFMVIFCETGLVVTPFLPGDSLLFTLGSLAANINMPLNIFILLILLITASFIGNQINYFIGKMIGVKILSRPTKFIKKEYLINGHKFYEKHGGKAIILARFLPIIRTFVPFVAGISAMNARLFILFNIFSAILWIGSLLGAGFFLGSLPFIKENFSVVLYGIIVISILPIIWSFFFKKSVYN